MIQIVVTYWSSSIPGIRTSSNCANIYSSPPKDGLFVYCESAPSCRSTMSWQDWWRKIPTIVCNPEKTASVVAHNPDTKRTSVEGVVGYWRRKPHTEAYPQGKIGKPCRSDNLTVELLAIAERCFANIPFMTELRRSGFSNLSEALLKLLRYLQYDLLSLKYNVL